MSSISAPGLVDTHCHLNFDDFDEDRAQVVDRARAAGINRILVPGIDIDTCRSALECARQFQEVYAAIGVHPNSTVNLNNSSFNEIKRLIFGQKVVAIGEIGLDYYRDRIPRDIQRRLFQAQLELAAEVGLPVIIHNRDASEDLIEILEAWHQVLQNNSSKLAQHPGVLHSFSGDEIISKKALAMNFKLGISGPVTFRNAKMLQSLISDLPLESFLIETDAPYLSPHPLRGKRNEPANVRIVAEKVAEMKQAPVEVVANVTTEAADQLFDWRSVH